MRKQPLVTELNDDDAATQAAVRPRPAVVTLGVEPGGLTRFRF